MTVYDVDPAALDRAAQAIEGVALAKSPAEVAQASDIVVTMLPSGRYVQEVALGENGLIHGFREGSLLLDTSSSEPWLTIETAKKLAERGVAMVDAPVSGNRTGARDRHGGLEHSRCWCQVLTDQMPLSLGGSPLRLAAAAKRDLVSCVASGYRVPKKEVGRTEVSAPPWPERN